MKAEQNSNERKVELFKKIGVDNVDSTAPVDLKEFSAGHLHGEYTSKDGDLLVHFFWREQAPTNSPPFVQTAQGFPAQPVYAQWPHDFRESMREAVLDMFKIQDDPRRAEIEWIPELFSWCVLVKGVCKIITPPHKKMEQLARLILNRVTQ